MAAAADELSTILVDLRKVEPGELQSLLEEESNVWLDLFGWDFRASADLVTRYVRAGSLHGYAAFQGAEVVGYTYYVLEGHKGLVGDVFVRRNLLDAGLEARLLGAVLTALCGQRAITRVETQLLMLSPVGRSRMPLPSILRAYRRLFLEADLPCRGVAEPRNPAVRISPWHDRDQSEIASLICRAYRGHVDSEINDQYDSVTGSRRFLTNIIQYPGCGSFFGPGSLVARDAAGHVAGVCLASLVAYNVGHITQICIDPALRGLGIGRALLAGSIEALERAGCRKVGLTVTGTNSSALHLYQSTGFRQVREFEAFVWDLLGMT